MDIRKLSDSIAVGPQIAPEDMEALKAMGFRTVIFNRPDGEEPGQPALEALREAAQKAGLAFHHIPVAGGNFTPEAIEQFRKVRLQADKPVFAFCRSGTRSATLELLANPEGLEISELVRRAREAGYDLSPIASQLPRG